MFPEISTEPLTVRSGPLLRRVDKVPEPNANRCELDEAKETLGGLVVASGHAPGVLETVDAPLNPIP